MDVVPTTRLIFGLIAFGFIFFFLNLGVGMLIDVFDLNSGGPYMVAAIWLFTNLPAVAVFGSALHYLMTQQKRTGGYQQ